MATYNKDFVVKNGLVVQEGGTFGNAITIGAPTANDHAATKAYVDALIGSGGGGSASITIADTAPESPTVGDVWFDSSDGKAYVYYEDVDTTQWVEIGGSPVYTTTTQQDAILNVDGGVATSVYGGITPIDGGGI